MIYEDIMNWEVVQYTVLGWENGMVTWELYGAFWSFFRQ